MADVFILSGSPGSGKTTVARLLAAKYERSVHLHTDDFWHMIAKGAIPPYLPESDEQNQAVVAAIAAAASEYARGGFAVIVDGVLGPWMLHHFRRTAPQSGQVAVHYAVLRPDRETALERAQQRTEPGALLDAAPILDLWDQFAELRELSGHAVDSTSHSAAATADLVFREFASGALRISGGSRISGDG